MYLIRYFFAVSSLFVCVSAAVSDGVGPSSRQKSVPVTHNFALRLRSPPPKKKTPCMFLLVYYITAPIMGHILKPVPFNPSYTLTGFIVRHVKARIHTLLGISLVISKCMCLFDVFLTVHHSIDFFKLPT